MQLFDRFTKWRAAHSAAAPRALSTDTAGQGQLLASLLAMAWFVEARDPYTGGHLWRVSRYAQMMAEALDLAPAHVARIGLGGFLHDLGKIGVPDAVLRKPDRLTEEEYAVIKTHPSMGARMLAGHPLAELVLDAVRLHHERPDGKGYPLGLSGSDIPQMARIIGVCDAFDAMTSHRPYRSGMPLEKALAIIRSESGTQFDAQSADALIRLGERGALQHVMGHSADGIPLQQCPACGPTLVLSRRSASGQLLYCRNCGTEFKLTASADGLQAAPTGSVGRPADLTPELDSDLIQETVAFAVAQLPTDLIGNFDGANPRAA
ncbi:HD domain-containing phosphohydrolase [Bordetella sp. FB-8]|uniref:HD domain-containing phosphohydrolase n=1 Tax=Bordetella sp. FB-8 TaxID=1159870 RepID=UPI0003A93ABE|nr:HD domain-containing phosphohydrolase [Bordetella sp. FB-8]